MRALDRCLYSLLERSLWWSRSPTTTRGRHMGRFQRIALLTASLAAWGCGEVVADDELSTVSQELKTCSALCGDGSIITCNANDICEPTTGESIRCDGTTIWCPVPQGASTR